MAICRSALLSSQREVTAARADSEGRAAIGRAAWCVEDECLTGNLAGKMHGPNKDDRAPASRLIGIQV